MKDTMTREVTEPSGTHRPPPLPAGGRERPRGKTKHPGFANPAIVDCYVKRGMPLQSVMK